MRTVCIISVLVLVCSFFCLVSAVDIPAQGARPYLVKISRTNPDVISLLRGQNIPVNFKLAEWYIAEANMSNLEQLKEAGMEYEILDREAWSQPYYHIIRPQERPVGDIPDVARVVYRTNFEAIVKIEDTNALELGRAGFQFTRLFQKPLPLKEKRAAKPEPLKDRVRSDEVIDALVNQVSEGAITSYVQRLQNFQTRFVDTDSILAAAQWLYDTFVEFGYTDVSFQDFVVSRPDRYNVVDVLVRNVIATKPGILYPDSVFIIGGHYDSILYDGTDPRVWAPGANDNGSGTVAVLEAARILVDIDLDCTIKFACWTAEEIGLMGSWYYAEDAYNRGEKIGLCINFDMIANLNESDPLRDVNVRRNLATQTYADLMVEMVNQYTTLVPITGIAPDGGSDHAPFMQYGYNILYGSEGDFSPNWHFATDVIDNMNIPYMSEVVKMGLATLATVAGPPESFPDPVIVYESYIMDDDDEGGSAGNENGHFDPGETVQITVAMYNRGDVQVNEVTGQLLTSDPYVTILDDIASFGSIAPGGVGTSQEQYRFIISEDCPNGWYLNFSIDANANGGYEWTTYFSVRVMQPIIVYDTFNFEEAVGNGDAIIDPGETVDLYLSLENTGLRYASGITALLETDDSDVTIIDDEAIFPDLDVEAGAENSDPFTFSLSEDAEPHVVNFTLHVSEGEGYFQTDFAFRLLVGQGTVLLVADDGSIDNQDYYIETFRYLGVPYDVAEMEGTAKSVSNNLLDYSEVIWFTGPIESSTLRPEDQSDLEAFLEGGGRLLLSGNMIGYDVGDSPFYKNYVHGRYVSFMTRLHHLNWSLNPVGEEMDITLASEGANAQGFAGETDPISPAVSLFNYDRETEEGPGVIESSGSGALAVETSVYKVVYCSFGLEGVEPLEDRAQVLEDVLLWFKEPGIDKGDVDGNGVTNIIDALVAVNIVLGLHEPTESELARADMNYDGEINVLDVIQVVNAVLGASGGMVKGTNLTGK